MNMNYGRLKNGRIEYAPNSLDTEDGPTTFLWKKST